MQRIIYADELVFINTITTFIMLLSTRQISNIKSSSCRLILASFIGGIYSLVLLAPRMPFLLVFLTRSLMSLSIVFIAFPSVVFRKTLKCAVLFLIINYLYCGMCYAAVRIPGNRILHVNNGFIYYNVGAGTLIAVCAGIYCLIFVLRKWLFNTKQNDLIYEMELMYGDRKVRLQALMDSGNQLVDLYTQKPVIVINPDISDRMIGYRGSDEIRGSMEKGETEVKFRLLPVNCVNSEVLLPTFTASRAVIRLDDKKKVIDSPSLAVTDDSLGENRYQALIGAIALR